MCHDGNNLEPVLFAKMELGKEISFYVTVHGWCMGYGGGDVLGVISSPRKWTKREFNFLFRCSFRYNKIDVHFFTIKCNRTMQWSLFGSPFHPPKIS